MKLEQVSDHCYAVLSEKRALYHVNSGFIKLDSGIIIDTQSDLSHAQQMIDLFGKVWNGMPGRVINTHDNGDHVYGNQLFADADIIASRLTAERFGHEPPERVQHLRNSLDSPAPFIASIAQQLQDFDFDGINLTPPTTTFEQRMELNLDGTIIELIHVGPCHTPGDTIVHFPGEKVIFAGDIIFRLCTPLTWAGRMSDWYRCLDLLIDLNPEIIVPGHGPLCGLEGPTELKNYFQFVEQEATQPYENGLSVVEACKKMDPGPYSEWFAPQRLYVNVESVYRELRGEPADTSWDFATLFQSTYEIAQAWKIDPTL